MSDSALNPPRPSAARPPHAAPARLSRLAVFSLILALVPCCPMISLFGGSLGLVAWRQIRASNGRLRGQMLAKVAAFAGLTIGLLSLIAITWVRSELIRNMDASVAHQIESFITAAQQNDLATARSAWSRQTSAPTGERMAAFGRSLQERYGSLQRFAITSQVSQGVLEPTLDVAGVFTFQRKPSGLLGSARFGVHPRLNFTDPELLIIELKIEDPDAGNLTLP